jgi:hypothetical protein
VKRIGELSESKEIMSVIDFFRHTESLLRESNEYVWLLVDQFPLNSLSTIVEAIERGVQFKIVEPVDMALSPDIDSMTSKEAQELIRARHTPLVEQKLLEEVNVYLCQSEKQCVLAFPTSYGQYDYTGFSATDDSSLNWCKDLFHHYWDEGKQRASTLPSEQKYQEKVREEGPSRQIIIEGRNDPKIDTQALQDAVDNFDEVILRGRFNLDSARMRAMPTGTTSINIRKSVVLRGEGREHNIPSTKIVKSNWRFPVLDYDILLNVHGEDIDVTIDNLHFQDFNGFCITATKGNSVKICNNRITLQSGLGRGYTLGDMGDQVYGIAVSSITPLIGSFPGGVIIQGNYLDFALNYNLGGFITRSKFLDPNYRPDQKNHENYLGFGIIVSGSLGLVSIRNNIVQNMNAKGIVMHDNYETAITQISGNSIISEIFGSYPFRTHFAGYGIQVISAWGAPKSGSRIEIFENNVRCDKLNYCGIAVYGPSLYREGAGKHGECIVRDNKIHLGDGSVGVLIRKNDETEVFGNKLSGRIYYGFHLWGSQDREGFDLGSNRNLIEDNDMSDLVIKAPDDYSDSHVDGHMFAGSESKSTTGHVWLNEFTSMNTIKIKTNETVIDEGKNNNIERR